MKQRVDSQKPELLVPIAKYRECYDKISCGSIVEEGTCRTFFWKNLEYVITGAIGSGNGGDWACLWGDQVVDLSVYKGSLEPLNYTKHYIEVDKGNRGRSYDGMQVKKGKRLLVIVGPELTFLKGEQQIPLTLF